MDARHDPNLILGYVEGDLTKAQRARFEEVLAQDAALASLVHELRRDREALREAPLAQPPRDVVAAAIEVIERDLLLDTSADGAALAAERRRFRLGPVLTYGGIAAVLALTLTVIFQSLRPAETSAPVLAHREEKQSFDIAQAPLEAQRRMNGDVATSDDRLDARPELRPIPALTPPAATQPPAPAPAPASAMASSEEALAQDTTPRLEGSTAADLARTGRDARSSTLDAAAGAATLAENEAFARDMESLGKMDADALADAPPGRADKSMPAEPLAPPASLADAVESSSRAARGAMSRTRGTGSSSSPAFVIEVPLPWRAWQVLPDATRSESGFVDDEGRPITPPWLPGQAP